MEKFSTKEKVALTIFGLILLAIVVQIVLQIDLFQEGADWTPEAGVAEVDLAASLLHQPGVSLSGSSRNEAHQTVERLADGNPLSYWHVAMDQVGEPAWVTADFGEGNERTVRALAALPREDIPRQFFRTARLLGSDDGENWENVADILARETPFRASWRSWEFENDRPYRFYRLLIQYGHEGGNFYSMAGLAFFE